MGSVSAEKCPAFVARFQQHVIADSLEESEDPPQKIYIMPCIEQKLCVIFKLCNAQQVVAMEIPYLTFQFVEIFSVFM